MDHKNLTQHLTEFTTQRVLRWCLLLEEFKPTFFCKSRPDNVLADALSRVPMSCTEKESMTTSKHLLECLSFYLLHVEFPSDQSVMAICPADCFPNYVAGQEAAGQIHPG